MSYIDTEAKRKRLQSALIEAGYTCGPEGADGILGRDSAKAIILFRADHHLSHPTEAVVDTDLMRELGLLSIQDPGVQAAGNLLLNLIISQVLKGTGINMDFAKVSKAIAGGIAGAGLLGGQSAYGYISLPADQLAHLPGWVSVTVPIINAVIGFAVGFGVVYFAPANKTTP